jgi:hypothetical protein
VISSWKHFLCYVVLCTNAVTLRFVGGGLGQFLVLGPVLVLPVTLLFAATLAFTVTLAVPMM